MRIIFFGSDDFAATHLKALIDSPYNVCACVTQPDKARGRGMHVSVSCVKDIAMNKDVSVFQPTDLSDNSFIEELKKYNPDLFVVIAYGRFLPCSVLSLPSIFSINVHGSLLPKYRGAAPINWAIINGESQTGLSIQQIVSKMDAGSILAQEEILIDDNDTAVTLRSKMAQSGPKLLLKTIDSIEKGTYTLTTQNDNEVTTAPKLTKELGHIKWDTPAIVLHNLARALLPWPSAYTYYKEKLLKILETEVIAQNFLSHEPGEVIEISKKGFTVATKDGGLLFKQVHLADSRPMSAYDFVAGHKINPGFKF